MLYTRTSVPEVLDKTIQLRYLKDTCTNETEAKLSHDVLWFEKFYQCPSSGYTVDTMPVINLNKNDR